MIILTNDSNIFKQTSSNNTGRVYEIGKTLVKVPQKVVDKIIEWNTGPERDNLCYDRKICHSLLLSLVHKDLLRKSVVSDDVMEFIKGIIPMCSNDLIFFILL